MAFPAIIAINFHSGDFITITFCFRRYSPSKIWKNLMMISLFLYFFHIGLDLAQDHTHTDFFAGFQLNMLENSIDIKNFNWYLVVLKKTFYSKTSKNCHFIWPTQLMQKRGPRPGKKKNNFFSKITRPDHELSKTFYFNKISCVLADLWMFFYFAFFFFVKK